DMNRPFRRDAQFWPSLDGTCVSRLLDHTRGLVPRQREQHDCGLCSGLSPTRGQVHPAVWSRRWGWGKSSQRAGASRWSSRTDRAATASSPSPHSPVRTTITRSCPASTFTAHPYTNEKLPYDVERDLLPITNVTTIVIGLAAPASLNVKTLGEF